MASALVSVPASSTDRTSEQREVAQCMELVGQVRKDYRERDDLYAYIWDVVYGRTSARIPKGYRKIGQARRNPLAVYYTNTITAALTVNQPATMFPVVGMGEAAQSNATLREHFFDASRERQEEEAEAPIFRRFTHSVVCLGEGVLKTVPRRRTAWAEYGNYSKALAGRMENGDLKKLDRDSKDRLYNAKTEEYKKTVAPYPIRSTDVQPETFYPWRGEDGMTLAIEHKRVPYLETLVKYGMGLDRNGGVVAAGAGQALPPEEWRQVMSGASTLTMSELWTWNKCRYLMSGPGQYNSNDSARAGTMVRSFPHRYGDPITKSLRGPYAHCYGTTTASRLPEHAGLGVLFGFLDLFVMLDELLTIQQINAVITGLASFKRNQPAPGTGAGGLPESTYGEDGLPVPREPETIEPGKIFPYDIGPIEMPRAGAALGDTIAQTREFIELILPKVLQGVVDTTDSGYQLALAARLGRIAFDPMVSNIRRAEARRVGFESWLIEHEIGETVYAWGTPTKKPGKRGTAQAGVLSIGPDDLKGIHRYSIRLEAEDKATELVEVRKHREMVDGKLEDISDAREAIGMNHEEVERKIALTEMKADPEIKAQLRQRVLQKIALKQEAQQQNAEAALAEVGQPAPGAALGGMGQVFEGGQNLPVEPGAPGLPSVPPGAPGGVPPGLQAVDPMAAGVP